MWASTTNSKETKRLGNGHSGSSVSSQMRQLTVEAGGQHYRFCHEHAVSGYLSSGTFQVAFLHWDGKVNSATQRALRISHTPLSARMS